MASSVGIFQEAQLLCHHSLIYKEQKTLLAFSLKLAQRGPCAYARDTHEDRRYIKINQDRELWL